MATRDSAHRALLVIIPALNEAQTIATVIEQTRAALPDADVLVINDGSIDQTAEVASAAGAIVTSLPFNLGVGGALRTGLRYAREHGYHACAQIDADGQHDPSHLPELCAKLDDADLVIGARFAGVGSYTTAGPRRWAMVLLSRTLSAYVGTTLTDTTSGFRVFSRRAIRLLSHTMPAEYLGDTLDAIVSIHKAGLRITQVPVEMYARQGGTPSATAFKSAIYLGRAIIACSLAMSRQP
ncbi:glycosyltransferase family 2 protein, partial [Stomatohabitans albus]|uniref:glycosyltransferase family 2 protein n=1 Tax=Stomatohabitans albus TaxID=3110766 RepID=UPI00300C5231